MNVLKSLWGIASCKATSHLENKNKEMASFGTSWSSCQEACIKWKHENRSLENQHATYPRVLWSMSVAYLVHGSSPRESEMRTLLQEFPVVSPFSAESLQHLLASMWTVWGRVNMCHTWDWFYHFYLIFDNWRVNDVLQIVFSPTRLMTRSGPVDPECTSWFGRSWGLHFSHAQRGPGERGQTFGWDPRPWENISTFEREPFSSYGACGKNLDLFWYKWTVKKWALSLVGGKNDIQRGSTTFCSD